MSSKKSEEKLMSADIKKDKSINIENKGDKLGKPLTQAVTVIDKNERTDRSKKATTSVSNYGKIKLNVDTDKEMIEIDDWELPEEMINQDLMYYVSFFCLLYLIRAIYLIYSLCYESDKKSYDLKYYLDLSLTISLIIGSLTGYLFCWKMNLLFAFPFLMFIYTTSFLIVFRIMAPIARYYDFLVIGNQNKLKLFEDNTIFEATIDCLFLLLNGFTSYCISSLYRQISQTLRAVKYKPQTILIDDQLFDRYEEEGIGIIYRNRKTGKSPGSVKSLRSVKSL